MSLLPSLPLAFFLPLLTALLVFLVGVRRVPWLPLLGALATVLVVADIAISVALDGPQRHHLGGWEPPLGVELYADGLAALMVLLTALVGLAVTLYAGPYLRGKGHSGEHFWPLWLIQWATLNGIFLSADLFNLYVMLELLTLTATPLAAMAADRSALGAALRYLLLALLGSLAYLLGVALLYGSTGSLHLHEVGELLQADAAAAVAAALITAGLFAKAAIFPLHIWLMPAHSNAPAPASAALSALVAKAAVYLLLRLWLWVFPVLLTAPMGWLIGGLGATAVLYGALQALRQNRLKPLIAYSTIAQLGYLLLLLPLVVVPAAATYAWHGVAYQALVHGLAKAAAFLAAGNVIYCLGHDRLEGLRGLTPYLSISLFALGLAFAALMGMPPTGGFLAKWLILTGALGSGQWVWAVVLILGSLLAGAYAFRVLSVAHASPPYGWIEIYPPRRVPLVMQLTPLMLALLAVVMGISAVPVLNLLDQGAPEVLP
ncbi:complex I subunit 5 family protein [Halorhodospira halochloris]|uniref:complex I subunit 5 family protein n=1 Tax=Halorhodospira halochloris TaxID=1052 RepID=UPI001EE7A2AA|nr:proton-conducting membrane transporter [Halorhodospira halochloris]